MSPTRSAVPAFMLVAVLATVAASGCATQQSAEPVPITFVEFYDELCVPCVEMEPTVEELENEYAGRLQDWRVIDIATDAGRDAAEEYGIFLTPTFLLLDEDGDELDRITGAASEETLRDFIERGIDDVS